MTQYTMNNLNPYILSCEILNENSCPPAGTLYENRRVKWYEIELILWGKGYIITDGLKIPAVKGDLFFRKPGMVVQGISPYYCYIIAFDVMFDESRQGLYSDPEYYNNINNVNQDYEEFSKSNFNDLNLPHKINVRQFSKFEESFLNVYDTYTVNSRMNQFFLKTYLMQILLFAYSEWSSTDILRHNSLSLCSNHPKVMTVKSYIDDNITSCFRLNELADLAGLSPNFLCRIFKEIMGESVIDYVNRCKINIAKKLLLETNKTTAIIAYDCGFENITYFYTLFKKKEEISPSEYRKRNRTLFRF